MQKESVNQSHISKAHADAPVSQQALTNVRSVSSHDLEAQQDLEELAEAFSR